MTLWEWKVEIAKAKIEHLIRLYKARVALNSTNNTKN